jgi:hypothetical protein
MAARCGTRRRLLTNQCFGKLNGGYLLNSRVGNSVVAAFLFLFSVSSAHAQSGSPAPAPQDQSSQTNPKTPAEQTPAQPQNSGTHAKAQPGQTSSEDKEKAAEEKTGLSKDRLFWTLPNFLTVDNAYEIPPLTAGQKFKVVARSTFDPVEFGYIAFVAAIGQAENSESAFGQGWGAYGERYATSFGDNMVENFMVGAVFPSILHQDPRYYQLGKGSFLHRTGYAIGRMFITRSDSGHKQFNYSEIFGAAVAAGISTYSYHPRNDQNVDNALSVWGTQIGWDMVSTVVKEFWPDIRREFRKEKQRQ